MKKPTTANFFELGRLLSTLNIKDDIKDVVRRKSDGSIGSDEFEVGYDLIMKILEKAVQKNVEKEIYEFLENAVEVSAEDLQDPSIFLYVIREIKDSEEWRTLFSQAAELIIMK